MLMGEFRANKIQELVTIGTATGRRGVDEVVVSRDPVVSAGVPATGV